MEVLIVMIVIFGCLALFTRRERHTQSRRWDRQQKEREIEALRLEAAHRSFAVEQLERTKGDSSTLGYLFNLYCKEHNISHDELARRLSCDMETLGILAFQQSTIEELSTDNVSDFTELSIRISDFNSDKLERIVADAWAEHCLQEERGDKASIGMLLARYRRLNGMDNTALTKRLQFRSMTSSDNLMKLAGLYRYRMPTGESRFVRARLTDIAYEVGCDDERLRAILKEAIAVG